MFDIFGGGFGIIGLLIGLAVIFFLVTTLTGN
jgi:hypothetical protein